LPSLPKIFHGREVELAAVLQALTEEIPRIAILGAGGMGKTSLARVVLHDPQTTVKYGDHRYFVPCDAASSIVQLATIIASYVGLQQGKNVEQSVLQHFFCSPPSLLVLDNLETSWEPIESRETIERFLGSLTDIEHLALIITMRGAERPANVRWTRPFLKPLKALSQDAARQTFIDIADDVHTAEEIDQLLCLADNMPLAIDLIAHLVDYESASSVLNRWKTEGTSLVSEGHDKGSNLDLSISLSLESPRILSLPQSKDLLSLLSILPDGLSTAELLQIQVSIDNILDCKTALLRTSLAYTDDHQRLKALVPVREYFQRRFPPMDHLVRSSLKYFQELLALYGRYQGMLSSAEIAARIQPNFMNIQTILQAGLKLANESIIKTIYSVCEFDEYSRQTGLGEFSLMDQIPKLLPRPSDERLEVVFITRLISGWRHRQIPDVESLVVQALKHFPSLNDLNVKCQCVCILYALILISGQAHFISSYHNIISSTTMIFQRPLNSCKLP
ncbi:P-loop containing nucleoside triphosphate hydrolase protein, partial [Mycena pura]